ncbi:translation machinery-associated protein 16 [Coemansia sp. RSA 2706]|nr:translation machinery-associated protein 16 [Coemansia sp. RSA 2711]KAJ2298345.1 translation machinery-associated protein 16 [Coemansia sp. RSA 2706]KAJ2309880.1 translation machinery-associated protein 16 [Coemansia sp. RSA 2705]KAJ2311743.1 translation machinery-associated protein 16 [Coemansia sp. RSA 2704]KAJ2322950.1 translation machinery-associated protein 16 [Coemansia sp. RSA 2702]KAJ2365685.1 translation machinery-associated protein 16 [Coemansia sp. RSA 2610]KAJ2388765.1 translat
MPNNKRKRLGKIKDKDKAHPYSRKARQISRAMKKEAVLAKAKGDRINAAMARGQSVVWFRDRINEDDLKSKKTWTMAELRELVGEYLRRNDEEIEELQLKKKETRGLLPRETLFLQVTETEHKEARLAGVDVPDLTNGLVVKTLRIWDGDVNSITTIKRVNCKPPTDGDRPEAASKGDADEQAISQATGMVVG